MKSQASTNILVIPNIDEVLKMPERIEDNKCSDFNSNTDKMKAYGIATLLPVEY
jgi:hypothetical protein